MKLDYITCSGTNEYTKIEGLLDLLSAYPLAEIGVQVSSEKCSFYSPRMAWINALSRAVKSHRQNIQAALHINLDWVEEIGQGNIVFALQYLLGLKNADDSYPLFQRIQLNFKINREKTPDVDKLASVINSLPDRRFILSYNESNAALIKLLYYRGVTFDCLFDSSFGQGLAPEQLQEPVFSDTLHGYAGGITPDNVQTILNQIDDIYRHKDGLYNVYIDAQKGLEDENTHLDLQKCSTYLQNASQWYDNYLRNAGSI